MSMERENSDARVLISVAPTLLDSSVAAPSGDKNRWADAIAGSGYACGGCDEPLPIGALVCAHCGTAIAFDDEESIFGVAGSARAGEAAFLAEMPEQRGIGRYVALLMVVVLVAGGGILLSGRSSTTTSDAAALTKSPAVSAARTDVAPPSTTDARTAAFCEGVRQYPLTDGATFASKMVSDPNGTWASYVAMSNNAPSDLAASVTVLGALTEKGRDIVGSGQAPTVEAFGTWLAAPEQASAQQAWVTGQTAMAPTVARICG